MPVIRKKAIRIFTFLVILVVYMVSLTWWSNDGVQKLNLVDVVDSHLERAELHRKFERWSKFTRNKTSFGVILTKKDREILLDLFKYFISVCEKHNITYFMQGGTLLGSWRHHGFIPWDDDIDIFVDINDTQRLRRLFNKGTHEYYALLAYERLKIYPENGTNPSGYPWLWPYVDVTFYLQNTTHLWGNHIDEFPNEVYRIGDVFPLHLRPFENLYVKSPHDGLAVLRQTFDSGNCETHFYSHKYEDSDVPEVKNVGCSKFRNHLAFVYRHPTADNVGIQETLILGHKTIHSLVVNEPSYAITGPFSLRLIW